MFYSLPVAGRGTGLISVGFGVGVRDKPKRSEEDLQELLAGNSSLPEP